MKIRINDLLTLCRIVLLPIILLCFYCPHIPIRQFGLALYIFACITDLLDGYYARIEKTESKFGSVFDPLADKLNALALLVLLVHQNSIVGLEILLVYFIVFREIFVTSIRILMQSDIKSVKSSLSGKIKTTMFDIGIGFLLANQSIYKSCDIIHSAGIICLIIGCFFASFSWAKSLKVFIRMLNYETR